MNYLLSLSSILIQQERWGQLTIVSYKKHEYACTNYTPYIDREGSCEQDLWDAPIFLGA